MITNDIETFYKNMEIHDKRKIVKLEKEIEELKENYEAVLRQRDDITKNATETIEKYQQENQELKNRINKAIKYVEENVFEEDNDCGYYWWEITSKEDLLKILKGEE